ncbi:MAG: 1-acyl-sn-glycerol-3-phosphate acyltransferase [Clostridia bacterium]|nr:1-acyl-sn-glycerol-3-phosphate acyltransferase [Clostridia bacterium]
MHEFFRWIALITGWPFQLLLFKRKTYYENRKKQGRRVRGGALIVSNHYSVFDYMVNLFLFPFRKLHVVYWPQRGTRQGRFFLWGMRFFGGIESDKLATDLHFMDKSVKVLEHKKLVQIYPEACITTDGQMHEFKPSYVLIALRADVPIIPVITDGNYGLFKRVHVIIGEPIRLCDLCTSENPSREEIRALNDMVYQKCLELKQILEQKKSRK